MTGRNHANAAKFVVAILAITAVLAVTAGAASATITYNPIYKNILSPLPGNVPSWAFEATSTSEFGGQVAVSGPSKANTKVTVAMSSWACQSGHWWASSGPEKCVKLNTETFAWPVTLKIYLVEPNGEPGPKIAQLKQTFHMPYRPTASEKCTGEHAGGWGTKCYHGKLFKITFALKGVYLSNEHNVIVSVSYNTSHYGNPPVGETCVITGCPYDSLNVGLTGTPTVGSLPLPAGAYSNSTWHGGYCPGEEEVAGELGIFRLEASCPGPSWAAYQPEFEVTTGE